MQLEDYFELDDPDGIRIRGHRIWLHHVLYEVVYQGMTAEGLMDRFRTLRREEIYACLLYIEQHREELIHKLNEELARQEKVFAEHAAESEAMFEKLRRRMAERQQQQKAAS
jgi:uncharacterized protein (DUF433 family)